MVSFSLKLITLGYIFPPTLKSIDINVTNENLELTSALSKCAPYLECLVLDGENDVPKNITKMISGVKWD